MMTHFTHRKALLFALVFTMVLLFSEQANAAPVQQTSAVLFATSFENETAAVTTYIDTGDPTTEHALINNAGQPLVNSTSASTVAGDLGFTATYFPTQGSSATGLTDGDEVGVTADITDVAIFADGSQGYRLNDTDGRVEVRFDPVTFAPDELGRQVSVAVYIPGNRWELLSDIFSIYIEDGSANTLPLNGAFNAGGFIDIDLLTTDAWFDATLNISEAMASGALVGDTFTLVFLLESNADDETIYIDDVVFSTTPDTTPPTVIARTPNDDDNGVSTTTTLDITFDEFVQKASTGTIEIVETGVGPFESYDLSVPADAARISVSGDGVTINPVADFAELTDYHVLISPGAITDLQDNPFAGYTTATEYNFTTQDATPPALVALVPADNATNVNTDVSGTQNLQVAFNEQVGAGAGNISVYRSSDDSLVEAIDITNAARVNFYLNSPTDGGFFVDLQVALEESTEYYVQIDPGAVVDAANTPNAFLGITDTTSWSFTTGDFSGPTYTTLSPADNATNVSLTPTLSITFNETVQAGTGNITIHETVGDAQVASFDVTSDISLSTDTLTNDTVSFTVGAALDEETEYYVLIPAGAFTDDAITPNAFAGISVTTEWSFTTGDFTAPTVVELIPPDDSTNVTDFPVTSVVFDETVVEASGSALVQIRLLSDDTIAQSYNPAGTGRVYLSTTNVTNDTLNIDWNELDELTDYYIVIVEGAVTDASANANPFAGFTDNATWNIQTGDFTPPAIVSLTPPDNDTNVDPATNFIIEFDENVQAGTGNITLYSGSQVEVLNETFDAIGQFTQTSGALSSDGGDSYYGITDQAGGGFWGAGSPPSGLFPFTGFEGNYFTLSNSNSVTGVSPQQIDWTLDINGLTNLAFSGDFAADSIESADQIRVQYSIDGSGFTDLIHFLGGEDGVAYEVGGDGRLTTAAQTFNRPIPGTGTTLTLRMQVSQTSAADDTAFDNFYVSGILNSPTQIEQVAIGDAAVTIVGNTVTYNPTAVLSDSTAYFVVVDAGAITDISDNTNSVANLSSSAAWNFMTGDYTAPQIIDLGGGVLDLDPLDDSTNVSTLTDVTVVFDESMTLASGQVQVRRVSDDFVAASFNIQGSNTTNNIDLIQTNLPDDTLVIDWTPELEKETDYYIFIQAGAVADASANANPFAGILDNTTWNFQTGDIAAPQIVALTPPDDDNNADSTTDFTIQFDESVQAGAGNITLYSGSQVRALEETFNDTTNLTTTSIDAFYSNGGGSYFGINFNNGDGTGNWGGDADPTSFTTYTGFDGNYFDASALEPNLIELNWNPIDITDLTNLAFSADFAAPQGWGPDDYILVKVAIDGGGFVELIEIRGDGDDNAREVVTGAGGIKLSTEAQRINIPISGTGTTLDLAFEVRVSAGGERVAFDNVVISGIANTPTLVEQVAIGDAAVTIVGDTVTYNPTVTLNDFVEYFIIVDDGAITDDSTNLNTTNDLTASSAWNFATGDSTAPTVQTLDPADDATNVTLDTNLTMTFDESVQAGTGNVELYSVGASTIATAPLDAEVAVGYTGFTGDVTIFQDTSTTVVILDDIDVSGVSEITISAFLASLNGAADSLNGFNVEYAFDNGGFTSAISVTSDSTDYLLQPGSTPLTANALQATSDPIPVTGTLLDVRLSVDTIDLDDGNSDIAINNVVVEDAADDTLVEAIDITDTGLVTFADNVVTINPTATLSDNTEYYVLVPATALTDDAVTPNAFAGITTRTAWSFTTGDFTGPAVVTLTPLDNATNVALDQNLVIAFDETVAAGAGNITIFTAADDQIVEQIAIGAANVTIVNDTVTINPTADFADLTEYYVIVDAGAVTDASPNANAFSGITTIGAWSFTTGDFTGPEVVTLTPLDEATNVPLNQNLIIAFDENVAAGTGNITLFSGTPQELFNDPLDDASLLNVTTGSFFADADIFAPDPIFGVNDGAGGGDFGGDTPGDRVTYNGFSGGFLEANGLGFGAANPSVVEWQNIDITGAMSLQFSADFASALQPDTNDFVIIEAIIDGGAPIEILSFTSAALNSVFRDGTGVALTDTAQNFQRAIPGTGSSLTIRATLSLSGTSASGDDIAIDNVIVTGSGLGTSTQVEQVTASDGNVSIVDNVLTFDPTADLNNLTDYYVTVDAGAVTDASVNANDFMGILDSEWNFTTGEFTAPQIVSLTPPDDAMDVALDQNLIIQFDQNVAAGTGNITVFQTDAVTELFSEPFDNNTGFVTSTPFFSDEAVSTGFDFFGISDGAGGGDFGSGDPAQTNVKAYTGFNGGFLTGMDLDGEGASLPIAVDWTGIDIAGGSNLQFGGDFAEFFDSPGDIDQANDRILVQYQIDGGGYQNLIAFEGDGSNGAFNGNFSEDTNFDGEGDGTTLTDAAQTFTKAIAGTGSTLDLRLIVFVDSGDEDFAVDNFIITSAQIVQFEQVAIGASNVTILNDTVTVDLATDFNETSGYYVIVDAGAVTDATANVTPFAGIANSGDWNFTTGDFTAPTAVSLDPVDDATNVTTTPTLSVTFDETVQAGTGNITLHQTSDDAVVATFDVTADISLLTTTVTNDTVAFTPGSALATDTEYYVLIPAGALQDVATTPNDFAGITATTAWSFTTTPLTIGGVCGDGATNIGLVQGTGLASAFIGEPVTIEGIVVGDYQDTGGAATGPDGDLNGFFVQEEDSDADGDPLTSDAVFIYEGSAPATDYVVGDRVRITGTVDEFGNQTQILPSEILNCASGAPLPTATTVTLPLASGDDFERYEGMLVQFTDTLVVTELFQLGRFGTLRLSYDGAGPNGRLAQFTQLNAPDVAGYAAALADNATRSFILDNGVVDTSFGENPDPIANPPNPALTAANTVRGGDTITNLTGIFMEWNASPVAGNNGYRLQPLASGSYAFTAANPRPATPPAVDGSGTANVTVASANVLNFFETIDDGSNDICGPAGDQECRGADSAEEFIRQRDKIVVGLTALDADVIGLLELENDTDNSALQNLVDAMNAVAGAGTYDFIATGAIGTDAIRVGIVYKPGVVTPSGAFAVLDNSVDPTYQDGFNRPTLAQTFEVTDSSNPDFGALFTVAVLHLKSKGSACDGVGDPDVNDGQGNCNLTRLGATTAVANWLATDPTGSGDADYIMVGDFNAYYNEDPLTYLYNNGYTNLFAATSYSYVFDGQWGSLDHAIANNAMAAQVTDVAKWHVNADEPSVLDYNTEFKSAGQITSLYAADAYRFSDHDPLLIGLDLTVPQQEFFVYLPIVSNNPRPDLIVEDVTVTNNAITVVIRNIGSASVTDGFYVDAYIGLLDPTKPPTGVNDIWQNLSPQGVVWGVNDDPTLLTPGSSITLTLNDSYQLADYTDFTLPLAPGTAIYVQVDSASAGNTNGGVVEIHEANGDPYNNVFGPVIVP
ncbi:MAG: ExeM/NucH family extracellular endonuclease [Ardenticatenaceae bacterium]|nr:ExeM/NucH family extracellular endonuclease [Ardenticatenaceae bacterium]